MKLYRFVPVVLALFLGCSSERSTPESGFGFLDQSLNPGHAEIRLFLATEEPVKGIEFTLVWNPEQLDVGTPELLPGFEKFVVHARQHGPDQMKILIFSMESLVFDMTDPWLLSVPVQVGSETGPLDLRIEKAVFAGSNSASYAIPVHNGELKID